MPVPVFVKPPVPEIGLEIVTASLRLKTSVAVVTTGPEPSVPVVPPPPMSSTPAEMVVVPV